MVVGPRQSVVINTGEYGLPCMYFDHARRCCAERILAKMIFGFNTDVRARDTVYHVQTEVRENERRLESQLFVSGRCVGKRSAALPPEAAAEAVQELARAQHRWMLEAIREGFVEEVLDQEQDAEEALEVQFLGAMRVSDEVVLLRFRVLSGGYAAGSAQVEACWKFESAFGVLESTLSNDAGVAEMRMALRDGTTELEVKVRLSERETMRRFLVKSARP
jgi:hypothetical protein